MRAGRELEGPFRPTPEIDTEGAPVKWRNETPAIEMELGHRTFEEVHTVYTPGQAFEQAARCLSCAGCCGSELCATVCEKKAIDYHQKAEIKEVQVGAVLVATGFKTFGPSRIPHYGYRRLPKVFISLDVERLVNSAGPTGGEILLGDDCKPKSVGSSHCVGCRDVHYHRYCSRRRCMYSRKQAPSIREHTSGEAQTLSCAILCTFAVKQIAQPELRSTVRSL